MCASASPASIDVAKRSSSSTIFLAAPMGESPSLHALTTLANTSSTATAERPRRDVLVST